MVQVDVFWSYGLGAGFALAAFRQLIAEAKKKPRIVENWAENPYLAHTILFLAVVFAPSGLWLLWQFTSWETMHALSRDMPVWLVAAFAITNITQGILGFLITYGLIRSGRMYMAYLQFFFAYFGMFFILVHGWDGTGFKRFFSSSPEEFATWTWQTAQSWLVSDVALTLYGMGIVMIPLILWITARWMIRGVEHYNASWPTPNGTTSVGSRTVLYFLASIFVGSLGAAIFTSYMMNLLGWTLGLIAAAVILFAIGFQRKGFLFKIHEKMLLLN